MELPNIRKFFSESPVNFGVFSSPLNFFRNSGDLGRLLQEYQLTVYSCINAITQDVGRYEPIIYTDNERRNKVDHEFLKLLRNPSQGMTQFELFEATETFLNLTGNAYWYFMTGERTNKPKGIQIIRPDRVTPEQNKETGEVDFYKVSKADGTDVKLNANEVYHFKLFNPDTQLIGLGVVEASRLFIETDKGLSEFQYSVLNNQDSPAGVMSFDGAISKEAWEKLKKQWREAYGGTRNSGKTVLIRGKEVKFQKVGLTLDDVDVTNLRALSKEDIREAFRVPEAILGKTDSTGLGRANVEAIEYLFAKRTVDPKLDKYDDVIRLLIKRFYNKDVYVGHVSQIPQNDEYMLTLHDKAINRWMTANEVRSYYNLDPIANGDEMIRNNPLTLGVDNTKRKKLKLKEENPESVLFDEIDRIEFNSIEDYYKGIKKLLKEQEKLVLEKLQSLTGKKQVVKVTANTFELEFSKEDLRLNLLEQLLLAIFKTGNLTLESLGLPEEEFILDQATRDAIFDSTERLMKSFNEETVLKIQKQLADGLANNESFDELARRIESIYDDANGYRAARIADTEAHRAINYANSEAYKVAGYSFMEWVARNDACEFCQALDGSVTRIGTPFVPLGGSITGTDGGEYITDYSAVSYGDAHPNCRCRLRPTNKTKGLVTPLKVAELHEHEELMKQEDERFEELKEELQRSIEAKVDQVTEELVKVIKDDK